MIKYPELTERKWRLLSAYLDGQVSDREKHQVEELLKTDPASRKALERLQRVKTVLRNTPTLKVPRNFSLSAEMVRKPFLPSFSRVFSYSSAAAALLLIAVLTFDVFINLKPFAARNEAAEMVSAPMEMMAAGEEKLASEEAPAIIYWGAPTVLGMYGKGGEGGGGGGAEGPGYATGSTMGIGGGGGAEIAAPETAPLVEEQPTEAATDMAAAEEESAVIEALPVQPEEDQAELTQPIPADQIAGEPLTGSGPILGVRPYEEQGTVTTQYPLPVEGGGHELEIPWRLVEIILAAAAVFAAAFALLFKKHR